MTDGRKDRVFTRDFLLLATSSLLSFAAFGASIPVMPLFVTDEIGGSDTQVGLVVGSLAVSAVVLRPFLGRLGDRRGLRILLLIGPLASAAGMVGNALVDSVPGAIAARLVLGVGQAATMTGATTMAVNLAPVARRGEVSSYVLVSFHLGLGLGPIAGEAVLDAASFDAVWLVLTGTYLVAAAVAWQLPNHRPPLETAGAPGEGGRRFFHPAALGPGGVMGIAMLGWTGFQTYVVLYAEDIGMDRVAPVFFVNSFTVAAIRTVGARLPDRLGPVRAGTFSLVLMASSMFLVATWQEPTGLLVATFIGASGMSLLFPSLIPAVVAGVPERQRASAMATFTMFMDVASGLGGPSFGLVMAASGGGYTAPIVATGVGALVSLAFLHAYLGRRLARAAGPVPEAAGPAPALDTT